MRSDALAALAAYTVTLGAAAGSVTEISDQQALIYAVGAGLAGGAVASLGSAQISWRQTVVRMLSSALVAPGLVWFSYLRNLEHLTLLPTVSACGIAGLAAWIVTSVGKSALESPEVKEWMLDIFRTIFRGGRK